MGFTDYFSDWKKSTADFYPLVLSRDVNSSPTETKGALSGSASIGLWYNQGIQEKIKSDKVVQDVSGKLVLDYPDFNVNTDMIMVIDGKDYVIESVDDIGNQGEVMLINWRLKNA